MTKTDEYRQTLKTLPDWEPYLLESSGLPGPRGNLELAQVVADEGTPALFERFLAYTPEKAPVNTPREFLAFCGVVGLGRLLAEGDESQFARLRTYASDPRWRTREAVAMALQRLGKKDMPRLIREMEKWASGSRLEQRAAAAALAEPILLHDERHAVLVLQILDNMTASMQNAPDEKSEDFKVLQKGLSYCWSVAVAAAPGPGKQLMEKWLASPDPILRRTMQENLKKNRLARTDPAWVAKWKSN